jgi:nicotinamide riboside transporter PnuC
MLILAVAVTTVFYFILGALGTARLLFSTLSVTTSFIAAWLTMLRSPLYAVGYAANDLVLIVLWVIAAVKDPSSLPMVACFLAFFLNDSYGFINWRRMERRQAELSGENP